MQYIPSGNLLTFKLFKVKHCRKRITCSHCKEWGGVKVCASVWSGKMEGHLKKLYIYNLTLIFLAVLRVFEVVKTWFNIDH